MDFRLELNIKPFQKQLNIRHKVLLMGSCFTDHMGKRMQQCKFDVLENPNGIIFNPASISSAIDSYIQCKIYQPADLFLFNELWTSWEHHSQFSNPSQEECLRQINHEIEKAHQFLKSADWLILTLGSSFVYELKDDSLKGSKGAVAANCHKVPAPHFNHRLLSYQEVEKHLQHMVETLTAYNPSINLVFTISPVRHYREGLVENNRSKALLHTAVAAIVQRFEQVSSYFPSYELVIDDLRDYRFYAEDLVHPNYQATQYVWDKFAMAMIDKESQEIMKKLMAIHHSKNHRPIHPGSAQHREFLRSMFEKVRTLSQLFPFLDLKEELEYFGTVPDN